MIDKKLNFILDKFLVEHNPDYDIDFTFSSSESIPLTQAANYDFKWRRAHADAKYNKYLGVVLKIVGGLKHQLPEYVANALDETKLIDAGNAALKQQIDRFYNITDSDINHKDKSGEARFAKYFTMTDGEGNLKEDLTVGPCLFKNMHRGQFYYPYPTKIDTGSQVVIKGRIIDALRKELTELTGVSKEDQKRFKWYVDFVNACRELYGKAPKAKDVAKAFGVTVDHVKGLIARSTNARANLKNIGKPLSYDSVSDGTEYRGTQYDDNDDISAVPTFTTANMTNNALVGATSLDTDAIDRDEFTKFLQSKYTITDAQGNVTEVDPSAQFKPKLAGVEPTEDDLRELADNVIEYYKKNKTKKALAEKERNEVLSDFCRLHKDDLVNYSPQELITAYNLHKSKNGSINTIMSMGALNVSPDEVEYLTKEAKKIKEARDNEIAELTDKAKRGEELTEDEQARLATALHHNYAALDQYEASNTMDEILDTPDDASPEDVETRDDLRNMLDYSVLGDPTCEMNPYKEGYKPDLDLGDEYLQGEFNRIKDTYYDPDLTPEERKEMIYNYQDACAEIRDRRDDLEMLVCRMNPENLENFKLLDNRIKNRGATVTFDGPEKDEPLEVSSLRSEPAKSEPIKEEPVKDIEPTPEPELASSQSSEPEPAKEEPAKAAEPAEVEPEPTKADTPEPEPDSLRSSSQSSEPEQKKPKHRINLSSLGLEEPAKEEPKVVEPEEPKQEEPEPSEDDINLVNYISSSFLVDDDNRLDVTKELITNPKYAQVKSKFMSYSPEEQLRILKYIARSIDAKQSSSSEPDNDQEMTLASISQELRHQSDKEVTGGDDLETDTPSMPDTDDTTVKASSKKEYDVLNALKAYAEYHPSEVTNRLIAAYGKFLEQSDLSDLQDPAKRKEIDHFNDLVSEYRNNPRKRVRAKDELEKIITNNLNLGIGAISPDHLDDNPITRLILDRPSIILRDTNPYLKSNRNKSVNSEEIDKNDDSGNVGPVTAYRNQINNYYSGKMSKAQKKQFEERILRSLAVPSLDFNDPSIKQFLLNNTNMLFRKDDYDPRQSTNSGVFDDDGEKDWDDDEDQSAQREQVKKARDQVEKDWGDEMEQGWLDENNIPELNEESLSESIRIFPAIGKEESVCQTLKTLTTNRWLKLLPREY